MYCFVCICEQLYISIKCKISKFSHHLLVPHERMGEVSYGDLAMSCSLHNLKKSCKINKSNCYYLSKLCGQNTDFILFHVFSWVFLIMYNNFNIKISIMLTFNLNLKSMIQNITVIKNSDIWKQSLKKNQLSFYSKYFHCYPTSALYCLF